MMITPGRRNALVVVLVAVPVAAALYLLAGAGRPAGGAAVTPSAPVPSSTAVTPTSTPSPTPSVTAPVLPDAAKVKSQKGAEAFFRYFFVVYNYGYAALDESPLEAVSQPGCIYCSGVVKDIRTSRDSNLRFVDGMVSVREIAVSPGRPEQGLLAVAIIDQTAGVIYASDGSVSERSNPVDAQRIEARIVWASGGWRIGALRVVTSK